MASGIVLGYVPTIKVTGLGFAERLADVLMYPFMYLVTGTFHETPKRTHFWNTRQLDLGETLVLNPSYMIAHEKMYEYGHDRLWHKVPLLRIPIIGGWKRFVVIEPVTEPYLDWHAGWMNPRGAKVSRLGVHGPVRLLVRSLDDTYFGFDAMSNRQIPVRKIGEGYVGKSGVFKTLPLL